MKAGEKSATKTMKTIKFISSMQFAFVFFALLCAHLVNYVQLETDVPPPLSDDQGNCTNKLNIQAYPSISQPH